VSALSDGVLIRDDHAYRKIVAIVVDFYDKHQYLELYY